MFPLPEKMHQLSEADVNRSSNIIAQQLKNIVIACITSCALCLVAETTKAKTETAEVKIAKRNQGRMAELDQYTGIVQVFVQMKESEIALMRARQEMLNEISPAECNNQKKRKEKLMRLRIVTLIKNWSDVKNTDETELLIDQLTQIINTYAENQQRIIEMESELKTAKRNLAIIGIHKAALEQVIHTQTLHGK